MRAALLTQVVPNPPDAGPKIKTHFALRTLAQDHDVDLISFVRSDSEAAMARELAPWLRSATPVPLRRSRVREPYYLARGWAAGNPFLVARDARSAFSRAVSERVRSGEIDLLHADQLTMGQYLALGKAAGIPRVFDAHNAVWELVRELAPTQPTPFHRAAAEVEWRLVRRFEGRVCRESSLTLAVSERDRRALERAAGEPIRSLVVPIGIEVAERRMTPAAPDANRLLSVATMHYPPNADAMRWFLNDIWPLVREARPDVGIDIAGARPPDDLRKRAAGDERVVVHGYVDDVEPLYQAAAILIVPLRSGSGVRVKILEAMARGTPVVSTSVGVDGLDAQHGEHLLIADTPADFARAVTTLLADPALRLRLARAARERALERYDWRACCRPLLDAYRELAIGAGRRLTSGQATRDLPSRVT